jgi:hypothetical protein
VCCRPLNGDGLPFVVFRSLTRVQWQHLDDNPSPRLASFPKSDRVRHWRQQKQCLNPRRIRSPYSFRGMPSRFAATLSTPVLLPITWSTRSSSFQPSHSATDRPNANASVARPCQIGKSHRGFGGSRSRPSQRECVLVESCEAGGGAPCWASRDVYALAASPESGLEEWEPPQCGSVLVS